MEQVQRLGQTRRQATWQIAEATPTPANPGDLALKTAEIDRLENDGDPVVREAMAASVRLRASTRWS